MVPPRQKDVQDGDFIEQKKLISTLPVIPRLEVSKGDEPPLSANKVSHGRPESWDMTMHSIDSHSNSHKSVPSATTEVFSESGVGNRTILAPSISMSSMNSSVSESLVDGEQAGILGGRMGIDRKYSSESLPIENSPSEQRSKFTDPGQVEAGHHGRNPSSYGRAIGEDHVNFILMYDMLTGIRHSVSVCQAKPSRPLTNEDFRYARTYQLDRNLFSYTFSYNFLQDSNETTPSKYEFRFKDYCPWVFRSLREAFKIDAADYLVS
jgi:hypothetical protein